MSQSGTQLARSVAETIGHILNQHWEQIDGKWWLFTRGIAQRALSDDEVAWHVARNHKPFVPDGIDKGHADWWREPQ